MTPEDIARQLEKGPCYIIDRQTREVFEVNGIFTTPVIQPKSIKDGRELLFGYGGHTWAGFDLLVPQREVKA